MSLYYNPCKNPNKIYRCKYCDNTRGLLLSRDKRQGPGGAIAFEGFVADGKRADGRDIYPMIPANEGVCVRGRCLNRSWLRSFASRPGGMERWGITPEELEGGMAVDSPEGNCARPPGAIKEKMLIGYMNQADAAAAEAAEERLAAALGTRVAEKKDGKWVCKICNHPLHTGTCKKCGHKQRVGGHRRRHRRTRRRRRRRTRRRRRRKRRRRKSRRGSGKAPKQRDRLKKALSTKGGRRRTRRRRGGMNPPKPKAASPKTPDARQTVGNIQAAREEELKRRQKMMIEQEKQAREQRARELKANAIAGLVAFGKDD